MKYNRNEVFRQWLKRTANQNKENYPYNPQSRILVEHSKEYGDFNKSELDESKTIGKEPGE